MGAQDERAKGAERAPEAGGRYRVSATAVVCTDLGGDGTLELRDWKVAAPGPGAVRIGIDVPQSIG